MQARSPSDRCREIRAPFGQSLRVLLVGDVNRACAVVLANVRGRLMTGAIGSIKLVRNIDQVISQLKTEISMAHATAALEENTSTAEDEATCVESTAVGNPVRHIHHQAYACWDSEETRHFYEDILEMPLIATLVTEDYCHTFFEIGDGNTLAFFEHMSLVHPKHFSARSTYQHHVAFEVDKDATVRQFKRKLDAAGVANTLTNLGATLRFNDPNGLTLEFTSKVRDSSECKRTSRSCAHAELQRWLLQRQNWWRRRPFHGNSRVSRSAAS
jgi:glyoxylase I family protein